MFIWSKDSGPLQWSVFRRPGGAAPRAIDEIPLPELVALGKEVLAGGLKGEEALLAMSRIAGMQQLRAGSRLRLEKAWTQIA